MSRLAISILVALALGAVCVVVAPPVQAQQDTMVTEPSAHGVRSTIDRFNRAVTAAGWVVFSEIDHAAAAEAVGLPLRPRTVVLFGNPRNGTAAMAASPTLALDLPMRVLVWEDEDGRTQVTRSTGQDIAGRVFARHGILLPEAGWEAMDAFIRSLVRQAVE